MAKEDTVANLSIKVSHQDMLDYTDDLYLDIANPAINGIDTHSLDEAPHNLPARFAAVYGEIDRIDTELANKLDVVNIDGKADVAGDTFTGTVIFAGGDEATVIDGPERSDRSVYARTDGVNRWEMQIASNDDELGANSGSNFAISRYDDSGAFLGTPFAIDRKTGTVLVDSLQIGGGEIIVGAGIDVRVQELEPTENLTVGTVWIKPSGDVGGVPPGIPNFGLISHIAASNAGDQGASINTVDDLSPVGNSATAVNAVVLEPSKTPNGSPALRGGSTGHLVLPSSMWTGKAAGHIFAYVMTPTSGVANGPWHMGNTAATTRFEDNYVQDTSLFLTAGASEFTPSPSVKNSWRIYEISSSGSTVKAYLDGTLQDSTGGSFGATASPRLLNANNTTAATWYLADFIAYDRALSSSEAAAVRDYLEAKNGPTGVIADKQYEAVMALSPTQYLPLTVNFNDYSGNNYNGSPGSASVTIGNIPAANRPIWSKGCINADTSTYVGITTQCPAWPTSAIPGNTWSWWSTRDINPTYGSWSYPDYHFGTNLVVDCVPAGIEFEINGVVRGTWPIGNYDSTQLDHYVLTIANATGYPAKFYVNGALVYEFDAIAMPAPAGNSSYVRMGNGTNTTQYAQHIAVFGGQLLDATDVFNLYMARTLTY